MSRSWLKQPLGPSHPGSRCVLQLAARSPCRDPRRLISRAADLSPLALSGRTMAPSLRSGRLGGPLLSAEPLGPPRPVVSGSSVLPCRVWRGSCVSVWQSLPSSSAGCEPDDSERSPVTGDRKLRWKLRELLGHTRGQRWINNDGNQTLLSIFFFFLCLPPWRVCAALSFPVRPLPFAPRLPGARSWAMNVAGCAPLPVRSIHKTLRRRWTQPGILPAGTRSPLATTDALTRLTKSTDPVSGCARASEGGRGPRQVVIGWCHSQSAIN